MAILRGGKRIGGYDIRIGLPRDRSLDDVQSDPRLRQKAGGNPETTMGRFQAMVNEGEGFARRARFYVEFFMPKGLDFGGGIGAEDTAVRVKGTGEGIGIGVSKGKSHRPSLALQDSDQSPDF